MRFAFLAVLSFPAAAYAFDDAAIVEKCAEGWGTDFQMVACCREQKISAWRSLQ